MENFAVEGSRTEGCFSSGSGRRSQKVLIDDPGAGPETDR